MLDTTHEVRQRLLASLRRLSDEELVARLKGLAARERRATALLVAHLAELDTRDVYLRAGYSSLFSYCRDVLALSEHEAYNRIEVARTARRFPVVLDLLSAGEVNLTTVRLLGPHLTPENHRGVLESARGKGKADIEEIVARLSPRADVTASVRKLPGPKPESRPVVTLEKPSEVEPTAPAAASADSAKAGPLAPSSNPLAAAAGPLAAAAGPLTTVMRSLVAPGPQAEVAPAPSAHPRRSAEVTLLSPGRFKYQLTIGSTTLEKLRLAKDMLRHALPSGDDEAVLDRALTALLTDLARKKFGADRTTRSAGKETGSSRNAAPGTGRGGSPDSRQVPVAVKRTVWVRDLGRCTFLGTDSHRCGERAFVEFHHVRPYAVGGRPTVDNIQLRCRRHNGYKARQYFAREPIGDGQLRPGTGSPARVSGTTGESARARSRTTRCEQGRSGTGWIGGVTGTPIEPAVSS